MTKTHELDRTKRNDIVAPYHDEAIAPGRTTRSNALVGPNGPMPSGIILRKARDANGVEDGAGDAVARAASSSGSPLPENLMRKFEGSLGADLSSVRVHTGGESEAAASAVGAKAYTLGQEIHFGAGHFDPSSTSGEHLLAHEVAHTVQQAGGVARMQLKPAVSSPGDSHEVEADRAADAMVSSTPFAFAGGIGSMLGLSRDKSTHGDAGKAGTPKAAEAASGEHGKEEKPTWPKVKDSTISGSFLGGNLSANWAEGGGATQAWKKGVDVKTPKAEFHKEFPIAPGIIGFAAGGFGASLGAKVDASLAVSSKQAPPPYLDNVMMMTMAASGGGSVEAKAEGFLKIGVGAGVANVLSISAGAKLALEASASIGVTAGGQLEAVQDIVNGKVDFNVTGKVELKAIGSIDIDVNVVGEEHNIASYTLGEVKIAEGIISGGASTAGGGFSATEPVVEWKMLDLPAASKRQTRATTPEEKAAQKAAHSPVRQGASGAGPTGGPDGPETVEMSDKELAEAGSKAALERLTKHVHHVVEVEDAGLIPGELVTFELDGLEYRGAVRLPEASDEAADSTRPVLRVLVVRIDAVNAGITETELGGAKTVSEVSARILHDGHVAFSLSPALVEFGKSPKEKREADSKMQAQLREQGRHSSEAANKSSDEQRDSMAPLPQSTVD